MRAFEGLTVRRKLTSISVISSMTALISASIAFLVYDATTFRERVASRLGTEAQIISFNAVTPLLFNDSEAAATTLGGLQAERAVMAAGIFRLGEGSPFAVYARDTTSRASLHAPREDSEADTLFESGHLTIQRAVQFDGKAIGHIVVRASLGELRARQRRYAFIVLVVLAASFMLAMGCPASRSARSPDRSSPSRPWPARSRRERTTPSAPPARAKTSWARSSPPSTTCSTRSRPRTASWSRPAATWSGG
jgi:hypothetical protein